MSGKKSLAERAAEPDGARIERLFAHMTNVELAKLPTAWPFVARAGQIEPAGMWRIWLMLAGRGFGKTRAGAEWVRAIAARHHDARIAIVGATMAEAREIMVEGESGLLEVCAGDGTLRWEPSLGRLSWRGGARAILHSAADPEGLRGPQHHYGWADEIAKWSYGEAAWDNLMLGMRLGRFPRVVATTTPRPVPLLRALIGRDDIVITGGRTEDNAANLPASFVAAMRRSYAGTRLERQELDGELIAEAEGALWSRELIERCRVRAAPAIARLVIGVDPPAGAGGGDACGIVAVGRGIDGYAYVLSDASVEGAGPERWASAVAAAAEIHDADQVIAEANNGGAMVESVLRAAQANLPIRLVHAARGKSARAEPVKMLYEAGRAFHVGGFTALEDEMAGLLAGGGYAGPGRSPDRADALVWAMSDLMLGRERAPGIRRL